MEETILKLSFLLFVMWLTLIVAFLMVYLSKNNKDKGD